MAPKLIQCIKFSFSLTAWAIFRWINNKSVPHSSSVFACRRGKNASAPSIVYRLLFGWNCHTTWSQGNLHYMRLHFLKLDWEFFCLQPSLARLYSAAASPSERLRSDGSLAISSVPWRCWLSANCKIIMHIREGAANDIKLVVIWIHIHVRINSISQIVLEDVPDERSKCRTLWASPGHPLPLAHYRS